MIFFVVVMVFGPVMMLRPTPGTNRIAKLRTLASQLGMVVRIPSKNEFSVKGALYTLPLSCVLRERHKKHATTWCLKKQSQEHDIHFLKDWDWLGEGRPEESMYDALRHCLASAPEGIHLLELNVSGVGVFWEEKCRGKPESSAVEDIQAYLQRVTNTLERKRFR